MATAKKAILHAMIEGTLYQIMVKTVGEQVWLDDTTTLSEKLAEMIEAINLRAKSADVTVEIENAVQAAVNDLIGGAPETYDTLQEIAAYIEAHKEVADALSAAIGNKADASTVANLQAAISALGSLAQKNKVSESDLDQALKDKVNAASQGNHSHSNKAVLDGITAETITKWNSKAKLYVASSQPSGITNYDIWIQPI